MTKPNGYSLRESRNHHRQTRCPPGRTEYKTSSTIFDSVTIQAVIAHKLKEALGKAIRGDYEDLKGEPITVHLTPSDERANAHYKLLTTARGRTCTRHVILCGINATASN